MQDSAQFEVANVEGTTVVGGFGEDLIKLKPGERVTLTAENSLTAGEVKPGIRDASCLEEES